MLDRRYALKIKIKSLTAEARIIRFEEKRTTNKLKKADLADHRKGIVRREARHTLLAYGFLRGRSYQQLEAKCEIPPNWKKVRAMVEKYGARNSQLLKDFDEWKDGRTPKAQVSAA